MLDWQKHYRINNSDNKLIGDVDSSGTTKKLEFENGNNLSFRALCITLNKKYDLITFYFLSQPLSLILGIKNFKLNLVNIGQILEGRGLSPVSRAAHNQLFSRRPNKV